MVSPSLFSPKAIFSYFIVLIVFTLAAFVLAIVSVVYSGSKQVSLVLTKLDDLSVSVKANAKETPSLYFQNNPGIGFYLSSTDTVDFVRSNQKNARFGNNTLFVDNLYTSNVKIAGVNKLTMTENVITTNNVLNVSNGTVSTPALQFSSSGLYKDATKFYTTFDNSTSTHEISGDQLVIPNGSGTGYRFIDTGDSIGIQVSLSETISFIAGGATRLTYGSSSKFGSSLTIKSAHTGSVASPNIQNDNAGIAFISDDIVFTTAGVDRGRLSDSNGTLELGVGASGSSSVALQSNYTDRALKLNNFSSMTITNIASPVSGMFLYNSQVSNHQFYNGSQYSPNQPVANFLTTGDVNFASITLGSGSPFSNYQARPNETMNLDPEGSLSYIVAMFNSTVYIRSNHVGTNNDFTDTVATTASGHELPSDYRPSTTRYFRIIVKNLDTFELGSMTISPSGVITIGTGADLSNFGGDDSDTGYFSVAYHK